MRRNQPGHCGNNLSYLFTSRSLNITAFATDIILPCGEHLVLADSCDKRHLNLISSPLPSALKAAPILHLSTTRYFGVRTTPSYSLLLMISSVWKKCFLLFSIDAESCWLPARFEWISSISPFRYFVVTL